jgi:hypothetical protein
VEIEPHATDCTFDPANDPWAVTEAAGPSDLPVARVDRQCRPQRGSAGTSVNYRQLPMWEGGAKPGSGVQ